MADRYALGSVSPHVKLNGNDSTIEILDLRSNGKPVMLCRSQSAPYLLDILNQHQKMLDDKKVIFEDDFKLVGSDEGTSW